MSQDSPDNVFTIAGFRAMLKQAFDLAERGEIVRIVRHGKEFALFYAETPDPDKFNEEMKRKGSPARMLIASEAGATHNHAEMQADAMQSHMPKANRKPMYHPNMAMPTSLAEGNNPKSPGYSAEIKPDIDGFVEAGAAKMPACCSQRKPCVHWIFNGPEQQWENELSGEIREASQSA